VWYSVLGVSGYLEVSYSPLSISRQKLKVFSGSCDALSEIRCGHSAGMPSEKWFSGLDELYYIFAFADYPNYYQDFAISVQASDPPHDTCDNAERLDVGKLVRGATNRATVELETLDNCGQHEESPGVWYETRCCDCYLSLSLISQETDFDATFTVFSGSNDCSGLRCVGHANETGELTWQNESCYAHILVQGQTYETGSFGLLLEIMETPTMNRTTLPPTTAPPTPEPSSASLHYGISYPHFLGVVLPLVLLLSGQTN
jgi:hypothetical protein